MVAGRLEVVAVEGYLGRDAEFTAGRDGLFQVFRDHHDLGQRFVPAPHLMQRLSKHPVRLGYTDSSPDLVGELASSLARGQGLVATVEVEQRHRLVDLQQQAKVVERGVSFRYR